MSGLTPTLVMPMVRELRAHRLGLAAVLATVAGDDLDQAVDRLEQVAAALPGPAEFPRQPRRRAIAEHATAIITDGLRDVRALRDQGGVRG